MDLRQFTAKMGRRVGAFAAAAKGRFKSYRPPPRPRHRRDVRRLHRRKRRRKSPQSNKQRPEGCRGVILITEPTLHVVGVFIPRRKTEQEIQHIPSNSASQDEEHYITENINHVFHFLT